jgi:hypothetical protein
MVVMRMVMRVVTSMVVMRAAMRISTCISIPTMLATYLNFAKAGKPPYRDSSLALHLR